MATGSYTINPCFTLLDNDGNPVSGGLLYTYSAGTSTPLQTFSDISLTTANANPAVADAAGRLTLILTRGASYKFIAKTAAGVTLWSRDNIGDPPQTGTDVNVAATAGELLTAGTVAYLSDGSGGRTAGLWYLADADNTYSSITLPVGMVTTTIPSLSAGTVRTSGRVTGLTGLTAGTSYYVSATSGALTATAPANKRLVGVADSTTSLILTANPAPFNVGASSVTTTGNVAQLASSSSLVRLGNASLMTIQGIAAGTDGQVLEIVSVGAGQVDLVNESGSATAADRILCGVTSAPISLSPGSGRARLRYDATTGRWRVLEHEQGAWITPTFSAANYTGSATMTWTVGSGDVDRCAYMLRGRTLHVSVSLTGTTVGGTPSAYLYLNIPGGFTGVYGIGPVTATVNGAVVDCFWVTNAGTPTLLAFQQTTGTPWPASTDLTQVLAAITLEVL